jgi:hypothetical protein
MIAKVRIAPVERWCENAKQAALSIDSLRLLAGTFVNIIVSDMRVTTDKDGVEYKWWPLPPKDLQEYRVACGDEQGLGICEHMLEMD